MALRFPSAADFRLNLHHFLKVLGRAEAKFPIAGADQKRGLAGLDAGEPQRCRIEVAASSN
jgi:hypothetical protein